MWRHKQEVEDIGCGPEECPANECGLIICLHLGNALLKVLALHDQTGYVDIILDLQQRQVMIK